MKKMLFLVALIVLVPLIIVSFFTKDKTTEFHYTSNINVRIKRETTDTIELVALEDYIVGVLAGEMPASFELEALKAQAVAARSYVLKRISYNKDQDYDVVDTITNQVYLDKDKLKEAWKDEYNNKIEKIKTAVAETSGQYLEYNGQVADALFFSTSVGMTENSEEVFSFKLPYLQSVSSTWDEISPVFEMDYTFTLAEFYKKLGLKHSEDIKVEIIKNTSTGRVKQLKINDTLLEGSDVVKKLSIKSNCFTIKQSNGYIYITTKGYGHGVGMSQYGAQGMALDGYKYDKILSHYYQGTSLKKI